MRTTRKHKQPKQNKTKLIREKTKWTEEKQNYMSNLYSDLMTRPDLNKNKVNELYIEMMENITGYK